MSAFSCETAVCLVTVGLVYKESIWLSDFSAAESALCSVAAAFEKNDGADHASSPFADNGAYFLI